MILSKAESRVFASVSSLCRFCAVRKALASDIALVSVMALPAAAPRGSDIDLLNPGSTTGEGAVVYLVFGTFTIFGMILSTGFFRAGGGIVLMSTALCTARTFDEGPG